MEACGTTDMGDSVDGILNPSQLMFRSSSVAWLKNMPEETNNPYAPAPIGRKRPERRKRNLLRQYISALLCFGAALMLFGAALMGFTVRMVPGEGSFIPPLFGVILAIAAMLLQLKGRAIWHASNQQL